MGGKATVTPSISITKQSKDSNTMQTLIPSGIDKP